MQWTGLTGDSHVSCQRPTASAEAASDRIHRCPLTGLSGALRRKGPTALNGSMVLEAYIYGFLRSFEDAEVATSLKHTQEHLQAIQVLIDHILSP